MVLRFLMRYGLAFLISISCLVAWCYYQLMYPEDFAGELVPVIISWFVLLAGNIGLVIHARQWWVRASKK